VIAAPNGTGRRWRLRALAYARQVRALARSAPPCPVLAGPAITVALAG
jgi:hypothetical protein